VAQISRVTKSAIARQVQNLVAAGIPPMQALDAAARQAGASLRSVRRWCQGKGLEERALVTPSRADLKVVIECNGNLKDAWRRRCKEGLEIDYPTFTRRYGNLDTDEQVAYRQGVPAALQKSLYVIRDEPEKMAICGFDHTEWAINCIRENDETYKPWISILLDWGTRYLFPPVFTEGQGLKGDPCTEAIVALLARALIGEEVEGVWVGGKIDVLMADNALAHLAEALVNGYAATGVIPHYIDPGSPWQNGRTEKLVQTTETEFLATQPGFTHHPKTRYGRSIWQPEDLYPIEVLSEKFEEWRYYYNTERPHQALGGRTPLQAWKDDPGLVERVDPDLVRQRFLAVSRTRVVSKNGIRYRSIWYTSPLLKGKVGRDVVVRYLPNDHSFIDVYLGEELLCRAVPHDALTQAERRKIAANRTVRTDRYDRNIKRSPERRRKIAAEQAASAALEQEPVSLEGLWSDDDEEAYLNLVETGEAPYSAGDDIGNTPCAPSDALGTDDSDDPDEWPEEDQ
jgi:transposase InsO family protein